MLLKSQNPEQATPSKKLKLNFGQDFKNYARKNKLVFIMGIAPEWINESFIKDPSTRSLWFQLQWFCDKKEIEEIVSDYAQLVKIGLGPLYCNHFYVVDAIINYYGVGGYLDLLDTVASSLDSKGFKVSRVILEHSTFKLSRDIGFDPFYAKPVTVDLFRSRDIDASVPLDALDSSLITLPLRSC